MSLVVPEWVARNERSRQRLEALAESSKHNHEWKRWNVLLRDIDPRLSYVFMPALDQPPVGATALRWHVVRVNETGLDTYWPLLADDGGYREITDRDFEDFKGRDLWNPAVRREVEVRQRRRREASERAKDLRREQRRFELASNVRAIDSPSVSFGDGRWSNRASGRRGRKK